MRSWNKMTEQTLVRPQCDNCYFYHDGKCKALGCTYNTKVSILFWCDKWMRSKTKWLSTRKHAYLALKTNVKFIKNATMMKLQQTNINLFSMRFQHDTNEPKTFPAQPMEQKLQDLPTMQKTILHKRSQRQQNILRQLQTRQHQRLRP